MHAFDIQQQKSRTTILILIILCKTDIYMKINGGIEENQQVDMNYDSSIDSGLVTLWIAFFSTQVYEV